MTPTAQRIHDACNRLALAKVRTARKVPATGQLYVCAFCNLPIQVDDQYREKGPTLRAHDYCFKAVARDYKVTL